MKLKDFTTEQLLLELGLEETEVVQGGEKNFSHLDEEQLQAQYGLVDGFKLAVAIELGRRVFNERAKTHQKPLVRANHLGSGHLVCNQGSQARGILVCPLGFSSEGDRPSHALSRPWWDL